MRQLIIIASCVGLFMYAGFAAGDGGAIVTTAGAEPTFELKGLRTAFESTGALLEQVVITGWVPVQHQSVLAEVKKTLTAEPGEQPPEIKLLTRADKQYLSVRWILTGAAVPLWPERQAAVRRGLSRVSADPFVTVQLEGPSTMPLVAVCQRALATLSATGMDPWTSPESCSAYGQTTQLPSSTLGVNIQVAARQVGNGGQRRVWVAWPALQQEY